MKKLNLQKSAKNASDAVKNTAKKTALAVENSAQTAMVKMQDMTYDMKLKFYNPLFPKQYESPDFHTPNMIQIVDDAVRKDIDVCQGAIGWCSKVRGVEVLHLYDEAIEYSGLHFVPAPICDTVYLVDPMNRNRFFSAACYYEKIHQSRMAELNHIASSLGAKAYDLEMYSQTAIETSGGVGDKISLKYEGKEKRKSKKTKEEQPEKQEGVNNAKVEGSLSIDASSYRSMNLISRNHVIVSCNASAVRPILHWYRYDDRILQLIDTCVNDGGARRPDEYILDFKGESNRVMESSVAAKYDGTIGELTGRKTGSLHAKASKEEKEVLVLKLFFK